MGSATSRCRTSCRSRGSARMAARPAIYQARRKMKPRRRLLTIGHSYCVALNRRLPHEIARTGEWDVTAVGPARFRGDFAWHTLEASPDESCTVVPVPVWFGGRIHMMLYGRQLS